MRRIGKKDYDTLYSEAKKSPRKRAHLNLHSSFGDAVQRLLISLSRGSFVEPHYHSLPHQWEIFIVLEGVIKVNLYHSSGNILHEFLVGDGLENNIVELQPGEIHSVECVSEKALLLEVKEGPFDPENAKVIVKF